jgi:hypothetical protein
MLNAEQSYDLDGGSLQVNRAGLALRIQQVDRVNVEAGYWKGRAVATFYVTPQRMLEFVRGLSGMEDFCETLDEHIASAGQFIEGNVQKKVINRLSKAIMTFSHTDEFKFNGSHGPSNVERLMHFLKIGLLNVHAFDARSEWPRLSGDSLLRFTKDGKHMTCTWSIEAEFYDKPTLRLFPFDRNDFKVLLWVKYWTPGVATGYGIDHVRSSLACVSNTEFHMYGVRGTTKSQNGYDQCESNVVHAAYCGGERSSFLYR